MPWSIPTGTAASSPPAIPSARRTLSRSPRKQLRQRGPQYADNPMLVQFFEQQVGQQLVQQQVLLQEAESSASTPAARTCASTCKPVPPARSCSPAASTSEDAYANYRHRLNMSVTEFEKDQGRHHHPPPAGPDHRRVTVSDRKSAKPTASRTSRSNSITRLSRPRM